MRLTYPTVNEELWKSALYYLERQIAGLQIVSRTTGEFEPTINGAEPDEESVAVIRHKLAAFLGAAGRLSERIKTQILFQQRGKVPMGGDTAAPFCQQTDLDGVWSFDGTASQIMFVLDQLFADFAAALGCEFRYLPTLISRECLEKLGYLPRDRPQIAELHCQDGKDQNTAETHACLTPAVCLPFYSSLAGRFLGESERHFTFCEKAFRREGGVFSKCLPLERIWEFHVREIVIFGYHAQMEVVFQKAVEYLRSTCSAMDLPTRMNSATDLFFEPRYLPAAVDQLLRRRKYELNFLQNDRSPIALASVNFHHEQFTKTWAIHGKTDGLQSMCIAFGLERWMQALKVTHGDEATVEDILKKELARRRNAGLPATANDQT